MIFLLIPSAAAASWTVATDGSGDFTSIQDAVDAASTGDDITVEPGTYEEALDFGGKDLTVVSSGGSSVTTIDGDGAHSFAVRFESGESASARLEGFTLDNVTGYAALWVDGASPTLVDLVVEGLKPSSGSAVMVSDGGPTFSSCTFTDNQSSDDGGHLHASNPVDLVIEDSSFSGGDADEHGGGVYLEGDCSTAASVSVSGSTFSGNTSWESNTSATGSDHLYATCVDLVSADNLFDATVLLNGTTFIAGAGGFSFSDTDSTWQDSVGPALYIFDEHVGSHSLDGSVFTGNEGSTGSGGRPGALYLHGRSSTPTATLTDVWIEGNAGNAGAVLADSFAVTLTDSTLLSNSNNYIYGGGLTMEEGSLEISGCTFEDNEGYEGGGLWAKDTVTIEDTVFTGNHASEYGGGAWLERSFDLDGCTFEENTADGGGAGLGSQGGNSSEASIVDSVFSGNITEGNGGGFFVNGHDAVTLSGLVVSDNEARSGGGLIAVGEDVEVDDLEITNNSATIFYGGANIEVGDGNTVSNVLIEGNYAGWDWGGARLAFNDDSSGTATFTALDILDNWTDGSVGGLFLEHGGFTLSESNIEGNIATEGHGGVHWYWTTFSGTATFTSNRFCDNTAGEEGGGLSIVCTSSSCKSGYADIQGNVFIGNSAADGASLYVSEARGLTLVNNDLLAGSTGSDGATLGLVEVEGAEIANNIFAYTSGGGAIQADSESASGADVWFNDFYDNDGDDGMGSLSATLVGTDDNIGVDPGFTSWTGDCDADTTLSSSSDLLNEGDPTYSNTDGSRADIGAHGGATPYAEDSDGDGYTTRRGEDCDDDDSAVYPGATETWYDGTDADCDGASDYDADGDGYDRDADGGEDCDDTDAEIFPGADDPEGDGIDSDCDGVDGVASGDEGGDSGDAGDEGGGDAGDEGGDSGEGSSDDGGDEGSDEGSDEGGDDAGDTGGDDGDSGAGAGLGTGSGSDDDDDDDRKQGCSALTAAPSLGMALVGMLALVRRRRPEA